VGGWRKKRLTEGLLAWAAVSMEEQAPPEWEEKCSRLSGGNRLRHGMAVVGSRLPAVGSIAAAILCSSFRRRVS
jgi:hypothetical protein